MKRLVFNVLLFGILIGIIGTVIVMTLGVVSFFMLQGIGLTLPQNYLKTIAISSVCVGLCSSFFWYIYILFIVRITVIRLLKNFYEDKKSEI